MNSVTCVKSNGTIDVASNAVNGHQGLAVVMTDEATPKVQSLALFAGGSTLAVSDQISVKVGSADVSVSGTTYTITGEARGADTKNPMAGMIAEKFSIKVTCS